MLILKNKTRNCTTLWGQSLKELKIENTIDLKYFRDKRKSGQSKQESKQAYIHIYTHTCNVALLVWGFDSVRISGCMCGLKPSYTHINLCINMVVYVKCKH